MKKILSVLAVFSIILMMSGCEIVTNETKTQVSYVSLGDNDSFAVIEVALKAEKIVKVHIDELQYMEKTDQIICVPNSDKYFSKEVEMESGEKKISCLASKRENNVEYSKKMKAYGKATKTLEEGYLAIEKYATGKTIKDLEELINNKENDKVLDAVSGATLSGTKNYISAIIETAKKIK